MRKTNKTEEKQKKKINSRGRRETLKMPKHKRMRKV